MTQWTSDQLRDYHARQDAYLAIADRLRWWLLLAAAALSWVPLLLR
jgi:hypothetical protein